MARRGENIHKRKDGRWEGRYIKSRIEQRILWGYVYGHSYAETREILIKKKAESGFYQLSGTSMTFAELSEAWLCAIANGLKESTLAHYRYTLDKYLLPVLGALTANEMSEALLEPALLRIFEGGSAAHKPLGTSSARECLSIVRRICHYAAHLRLIRPLDICVRLPDRKRPGQPPLSMEKQQELQAFLLQTPTPRKIGVLLGMQMGLRIGEICGLQWGDFDLKREILFVQRTVCRISCGNGHTKVIIQRPKTRTSKREIPIPKHLLPALRYFAATAAQHANRVGVGHRKVYNYRLNNVNSGVTNYNVQHGLNALKNIQTIKDNLYINTPKLRNAADWHIWNNYFFLLKQIV